MTDFVRLENGRLITVKATADSQGVDDANRVIKTRADGKIDESLLPEMGDYIDTFAMNQLTAGQFVYIDSTSGDANPATSTQLGLEAVGFVKVDTPAGQAVRVYFEGIVPSASFVVPGARYYLGQDGFPTEIIPSAGAGDVVQQFVGKAVGLNAIAFEGDDVIVLADNELGAI